MLVGLLLFPFVHPQFVLPAQAQTTDDLVLVNVAVTADSYRPLEVKLKKENFRVFEDKQEQEVQYFSTEDTPVSLGVLFDVSGSMKGDYRDKLEVARQALIEFLQASNPQDEAFMIAFSDHVDVLFEWMALNGIQEIPHLEAKKHTALLDAVYLGIEKMRDAHNARRALLIVSDGGDNASHYSKGQIKERLKETNVQINAICIPGRPPSPEAVEGPRLLGELTDLTGGLTFCAAHSNDLFDAARMLAELGRNQYVLGYRSKNTARDGRWRKIEVKLVQTKGTNAKHAHSRPGYYAPGGPEAVSTKHANAK